MKRVHTPLSRISGLEHELLELIREVLPKAIEAGDIKRVEVLEERLAQGGLAQPNSISRVWNGPPDVPRNEVQVREMYAHRMPELGYRVAASQEAFPDWCLEKLDTGEFLFAEVEHKSSAFYTHGHAQSECDLIVCWEHDARGVCIPVIELFSGQVHEPRTQLQEPDDEAKLRAFGAYASARYNKPKVYRRTKDPLERAAFITGVVDFYVQRGMSKRDAVRYVAELYDFGQSTVWAILKKRREFGI